MTYLHIQDQGLPKHALGERRTDRATADNVQDALRAHGVRTAAKAMEYQQVDLAVALRVLSDPARRRARAHAAAMHHAQAAQPHGAGAAALAAIPA